MGSSEGYTMADRCITSAASEGSWVLLRNIHLCPAWRSSLEKRLYTLSPHTNFRLFLTSEIHPAVHANLCRLGTVKIFEAPVGVKASLQQSLNSIPAERMNRAPVERSRLYLLLVWFHAVVLERRRYCPIGWTKEYGFGDSDQKCSLDAIDYWVEAAAAGRSHVAPKDIPWKALQTLLAQTMYGGRIDNRFDDLNLTSFVQRLFVVESFDVDFKLAPAVVAPEGTTKEHFLKWLDALPATNPPDWLGLPGSAQSQLLKLQGQMLLDKLARMQAISDDDDGTVAASLTASAAGTDSTADIGDAPVVAPTWMLHAAKTAAKWRALLPDLPPLQRRPKSITFPLFRCVEREVRQGRKLLKTIRDDLQAVRAVVGGQTKFTNRLRAIMREISKGRLPDAWAGTYPTSDTTASAWVADTARRLRQLAALVEGDAETPVQDRRWDLASQSLWLGGMAAAEAFLTATRQAVARVHKCSLEDLRLELTLASLSGAQAASTPSAGDSFVVSGLSMEGAGWDGHVLTLSEAMSCMMPPVRFRWTTEAAKPDGDNVALEVPVYLNSTRADLLFVVKLHSSTDHHSSLWRQRGVALICWSPQL